MFFLVPYILNIKYKSYSITNFILKAYQNLTFKLPKEKSWEIELFLYILFIVALCLSTFHLFFDVQSIEELTKPSNIKIFSILFIIFTVLYITLRIFVADESSKETKCLKLKYLTLIWFYSFIITVIYSIYILYSSNLKVEFLFYGIVILLSIDIMIKHYKEYSTLVEEFTSSTEVK